MEELKAFKSYTTVQKQSVPVAKVGMVHNEIIAINTKFQVSVQFLLYNEK